METSVTQPREDELIGIDGIRHLTSLSREQVSEITIEFDLDRNVDEAANDVRDRVARVRGTLPEEAEDPVVAKSDADASPIIWMALASDRYGQLELSTIAETRLKDRFSKLPGIATVIIAGERRHAMRVWVDNVRLTAANLTIAEVADALARENVDLPSGRVEGMRRLRAQGRDLATATFEASVTRFRPILMTAISTVVGILPIAIGSGAGGELRAPPGIAVAGGIVCSTARTIFVVPAAYLVVAGLRIRWRPERMIADAPFGPHPAFDRPSP